MSRRLGSSRHGRTPKVVEGNTYNIDNNYYFWMLWFLNLLTTESFIQDASSWTEDTPALGTLSKLRLVSSAVEATAAINLQPLLLKLSILKTATRANTWIFYYNEFLHRRVDFVPVYSWISLLLSHIFAHRFWRFYYVQSVDSFLFWRWV